MPLTICPALVADNITCNCTNPIFTGLEEIGYIINKRDIASWTVDTNNDHIMKAVALLTGKKAYKIYNPTKTPFTGAKTTMVEGAVRNKFDKVVPFILPNDGPGVAKDIVDQLANGEFVVILANKWENTTPNNKFEIYGKDKGMRATAIENDKYSEDTDGGWSIELTESATPISAYYLYDTDVATTRTALENLC